KPAAPASEVDKLKTTIVCLKREIENRDDAVGRLKLALHQAAGNHRPPAGPDRAVAAAQSAAGCRGRSPRGDGAAVAPGAMHITKQMRANCEGAGWDRPQYTN